MIRIVVLMLVTLFVFGCGERSVATKKEPMLAQVGTDGTITISFVVYLNGDPKTHGHSELVIAPTDSDYDAWISFLEAHPGEHKEFDNWPQFYLDRSSEKK